MKEAPKIKIASVTVTLQMCVLICGGSCYLFRGIKLGMLVILFVFYYFSVLPSHFQYQAAEAGGGIGERCGCLPQPRS